MGWSQSTKRKYAPEKKNRSKQLTKLTSVYIEPSEVIMFNLCIAKYRIWIRVNTCGVSISLLQLPSQDARVQKPEIEGLSLTAHVVDEFTLTCGSDRIRRFMHQIKRFYLKI